MTTESIQPSRNIVEAARALESQVPPLVAQLAAAAARNREAALEHARASRVSTQEMRAARPEESLPENDLTGRFKRLEPK